MKRCPPSRRHCQPGPRSRRHTPYHVAHSAYTPPSSHIPPSFGAAMSSARVGARLLPPMSTSSSVTNGYAAVLSISDLDLNVHGIACLVYIKLLRPYASYHPRPIYAIICAALRPPERDRILTASELRNWPLRIRRSAFSASWPIKTDT